ncbi:hypothetical protein K505DRAFT_420005 [Melanomma pulvis-pyrius CBS 109.77]|uniref:VOC domain-containing protein n=1 Tax=Melanomma pulvis-pyrius CBS 109.77 TaxID=1314802 RepID=A0A6A6X1W0_9PLEO|nr:hypothetical protein K505DRAFT_420005 [Melanomma pulvis-pyrius CBS 109.77]
MRFSLFVTALLPAALACNHANLAQHEARNDSAPPFKYTEGTDGPADPATRGYFVNHVGLVVSNITASREWYSTVLGMRHIFTMDLSDQYSIMYMGHAQGGRNGTGFQTGAELARDKNNLGGLVEFIEYKKSSRKYAPGPSNTLSHMGLIVDDLLAAQARFDSLNVETVKRAGDLDFSAETGNPIFASAWGFDSRFLSSIGGLTTDWELDFTSEEEQAAIQAVLPALGIMGFKELIVIADPDGNLFEVQSLVPTLI